MLLATNAKLQKSTPETESFLLAGLTLAPHGLSGFEVCNGASAGCRSSCNMWFSGLRVTPQARYRAVGLTRWLLEDRDSFLRQLHRDIARHVRRAEQAQLRPIIRLNMASDLDWLEVIERWPCTTFIDYTKIRSRFEKYLRRDLPENYFLTFSRHEKHKRTLLLKLLNAGGNVAQVFEKAELPQTANIGPQKFPVVDGDRHDVRLPEIDGSGVIVGLRLKGTNASKQKAKLSGFAS
ncbi:MAG: hypothetical protein Fues2KO_46720 [Fuerstiella sp.]